MAQLAHDYPDASAGISGEILSFWKAPRGPQRMLISGLAILQGVMLLLLLAVCGNTANLMLARGSTRQREMAVRVALGAGRWRIVSLVLSENMLLALLGAGLGAAFAVWGTTALRIAPHDCCISDSFSDQEWMNSPSPSRSCWAPGVVCSLAPPLPSSWHAWIHKRAFTPVPTRRPAPVRAKF